MKNKIVPSEEITAARGFRAEDYINEDQTLEDVSDIVWNGINEVAALVYKTATAHGWWSKYADRDGKLRSAAIDFLPEIIGSKLMLQVSELAEALEEIRSTDHAVNEVYYKEGKPEGVPIELADTVIRIFDFCAFFGIDIAEAIKVKMAYNESRPFKHGGKTI